MRFPEFRQALLEQYGEEAAATRHEAFFLAGRGGTAVLRALFAALRDAWLCLRLPERPAPLAGWVALATLPGSNGWGRWRRAWPIWLGLASPARWWSIRACAGRSLARYPRGRPPRPGGMRSAHGG